MGVQLLLDGWLLLLLGLWADEGNFEWGGLCIYCGLGGVGGGGDGGVFLIRGVGGVVQDELSCDGCLIQLVQIRVLGGLDLIL